MKVKTSFSRLILVLEDKQRQ